MVIQYNTFLQGGGVNAAEHDAKPAGLWSSERMEATNSLKIDYAQAKLTSPSLPPSEAPSFAQTACTAVARLRCFACPGTAKERNFWRTTFDSFFGTHFREVGHHKESGPWLQVGNVEAVKEAEHQVTGLAKSTQVLWVISVLEPG